jgi:hypothetical protein
LPSLGFEQTESKDRDGVIRVHRQNATIDRLGVGEPAGAMVLAGDIHGPLDLVLRHAGILQPARMERPCHEAHHARHIER